MTITTIGLDTSKTWFQVHCVDADGRTVLRRKLARSKVLSFFASAVERTFEEGVHALVDFLAQFRDLALRDAGEPHHLRDLVDRRVETPPIQASWMTATSGARSRVRTFSTARQAATAS